jgi:hypothetical protein
MLSVGCQLAASRPPRTVANAGIAKFRDQSYRRVTIALMNDLSPLLSLNAGMRTERKDIMSSRPARLLSREDKPK